MMGTGTSNPSWTTLRWLAGWLPEFAGCRWDSALHFWEWKYFPALMFHI